VLSLSNYSLLDLPCRLLVAGVALKGSLAWLGLCCNLMISLLLLQNGTSYLVWFPELVGCTQHGRQGPIANTIRKLSKECEFD